MLRIENEQAGRADDNVIEIAERRGEIVDDAEFVGEIGELAADYVLTGGANNTGSVSILGYDNLFKAFNLGLGSAISVLIFLSVAIIAFIFIKLFGASAPGSSDEGRL